MTCRGEINLLCIYFCASNLLLVNCHQRITSNSVSSKDESGLVTSYQQIAADKLPVIPSYQGFRAFVEVKAREGNEGAQKLMERISKDESVIEMVLKLLSIQLEEFIQSSWIPLYPISPPPPVYLHDSGRSPSHPHSVHPHY